MELRIICNQFNNDDVINMIESAPEWNNENVKLSLIKKDFSTRSLDPTIISAIISSVGLSFSALITGLFLVSQKAKDKRIIIRNNQGDILAELYGNHSIKAIQEVVSLLKEVNDDIVEFEIQ